MVTILLATLGVPIWLIVGILAGSLWSRRTFKATEGVFKIAIRDGGDDSWPRATGYARAVHDVLVVNKGLALIRTRIHPVRQLAQIAVETSPKRIDDATFRRLELDDGTSIEVAVSAADADQIDGMIRADR